MSEQRGSDQDRDQQPVAAEEGGIGAAAEEEGVVDQQAVLKDQIDEEDG